MGGFYTRRPKIVPFGLNGRQQGAGCGVCTPHMNSASTRAPHQQQHNMLRVPPVEQRPRGPINDLHRAACHGSAFHTAELLSCGSIDINQGHNPCGITPLMLAAQFGHACVAKMLLRKGSDVSIVSDEGATALHFCSENGHLALVELLIGAGARTMVDAPTSQGHTPLHAAAYGGHWEVARALMDAGANPNSRLPDGMTPLFSAACKGHVRTIKELLRAGANPAAIVFDPKVNVTVVPLDAASGAGRSEAIRELIQQFGIKGCGGPSAGIRALCQAARERHTDVMAQLANAGVVDKTGRVLHAAVMYGAETSVKLLLRHREGNAAAQGRYVNNTLRHTTPLLTAIQTSRSWCPRVMRMLIDAGADTTFVFRVGNAPGGEPIYAPTPLSCAHQKIIWNSMTGGMTANGNPATEEAMRSLEGIRRLLLQVEAVHAVSWLFPSVATPAVVCLGEGEGARGSRMATSTPLRVMLPILCRRTERRGVLLAAMFRWAVVCDVLTFFLYDDDSGHCY